MPEGLLTIAPVVALEDSVQMTTVWSRLG
jgi:hypothetical protein